LPEDVVSALREARREEAADSPARRALDAILENVAIAARDRLPMCQDTGLPVFFVEAPPGADLGELTQVLTSATRRAVTEVPLRSNAVDPVTGHNPGDGTGPSIPAVHFEPSPDDRLHVHLLLKGGGSENVGRLYSLPGKELGAGRDLAGIKAVVLDAVVRAQGLGCPPTIVGVAIAGARDTAAALSKRQLLRPVGDSAAEPDFARFERELTEAANRLSIGPAGLGGKTTVLGVKVGVAYRHPASYFVDVSFCCWACRRGTLDWPPEKGEG
jgi:fumarate hydratase class I